MLDAHRALSSVMLLFFAATVCGQFKALAPNSWKFDGLLSTDKWWSAAYPMCDGIAYPEQSPVNLTVSQITPQAASKATLRLVGALPEPAYNLYGIINSGTASFNAFNTLRTEVWASEFELIADKVENIPRIARGTSFFLNSITFHGPAEHRVDGTAYPLEMEYLFFREAAHSPGEGSLLISVLLSGRPSSADQTRTRFDEMLSVFNEVDPLTEVAAAYEGYSLIPLALPPTSTNVVVYNGSLSSPPCLSAATVLVYLTPVLVDPRLLNNILKLLPRPHNGRRAQPLNGRRLDMVSVTMQEAELLFPYTAYTAPANAAAKLFSVADDEPDMNGMAIQFSTLYIGLVVLQLLVAAGWLLFERRSFVSYFRDEWASQLDGKADFGSPPAPLAAAETEVNEEDEESDYSDDDEDDE
jgi:carbonic anhydrase